MNNFTGGFIKRSRETFLHGFQTRTISLALTNRGYAFEFNNGTGKVSSCLIDLFSDGTIVEIFFGSMWDTR